MKKTKPTLSEEFAALRSRRGLTFQAIGELCDLDPTTILKVEAGRSIRWETLHLILTLGMNVKMGTPPYNEFHAMWLEAKASMVSTRRKTKGKKSLSKAAAAAVKEFREIVRPLNEEQINRVMIATAKTAVKVTDL